MELHFWLATHHWSKSLQDRPREDQSRRRVSLVKYPSISLNQNTRNVTVGRKPCEKDVTPTWVIHELFRRPSVNDQSTPATKAHARLVRTFSKPSSRQSYVFSSCPDSTFYSRLIYKDVQIMLKTKIQPDYKCSCTLCMRDEHEILFLKCLPSICFTLPDKCRKTCLHCRAVDFFVIFLVLFLFSKIESKLIWGTAAKLLLSEAVTSSDTDDLQYNWDSSTNAIF